MKTFHSSGTASGKVERMWRWKTIIPATAIVPIVPPWESEQDQRQGELDHGAHVGGQRAGSTRAAGPRGGRGRAAASAPSNRFQGVLLIITVTTKGKWRFSFEEAAPHQMQTKTSCAATIMLVSGKRKTIIRLP